MILTKEIEIIGNGKTYKHYENLGYVFKIGEFFSIKIEDLITGSTLKIKVKCDVCENEKEIPYRTYNKNIEKYGFYSCSHKCANNKRQKTNMILYGVKNCFQNENIKEISKKTKSEKYGDENYTNSNKRKKTCLEKYGSESPLGNIEIRKVGYETNLKKYGVKHPSGLDYIIDKVKKTKLEKYGNQYYTNIDKYKKTCLEKYNSVNWMKSDDYKKKQIEKSSIKYNCNIIEIDSGIYEIKCDKCKNNFFITINNLIKRQEYGVTICTICKPINDSSSDDEKKLKDFISSEYDREIKYNDRDLINPKELDIYLPDLKLAFEFNGVYWHNELYKSNNYHFNKTEDCIKKNIKLINIYQDDWIYKQDIVKSRILNLLGKSNKIMARKTEIKEITDNKLIRTFLEKNHIQGFVGSKIKIGLFYNDELISLMTFGNLRKSMGQKPTERSYEMLRFCNKLNTNVVGGASRLFKYFIFHYKPKEVISYADRSWSNGNLYEKLGFSLIHKTKPNYYYVIDGIRKHRFGFRKDILIKNSSDLTKTEHEIMLEKGIYRIYDSGSFKYSYISL